MAITIRAQYARTRDRLSQQIFVAYVCVCGAPVTKQNQTCGKRMSANFWRVAAANNNVRRLASLTFSPKESENLGASSAKAAAAAAFLKPSVPASPRFGLHTRLKVNLFMMPLKYSLNTRDNARARLTVIPFSATFSPETRCVAFICAHSRDLRRAQAPHLLWITCTFVNYERRVVCTL